MDVDTEGKVKNQPDSDNALMTRCLFLFTAVSNLDITCIFTMLPKEQP